MWPSATRSSSCNRRLWLLGPRKNSLYLFQQGLTVKGFDDETIRPRFATAVDNVFITIPGNHQDRRALEDIGGAQATNNFRPGNTRQININQHQIRTQFTQLIERIQTVNGGRHVKTFVAQNLGLY